MDGSNAATHCDISIKALKSTVDINSPSILKFMSLICQNINFSIEEGLLPDELKPTEVSPMFKKKDSLDKEN